MENSIKSKTIEWLRFFCIGAVVFLHAEGNPIEGHDVISYQYGAFDTIRILFSDGLCRIAVPILFFISGNLFFVRLEKWDKAIWLEKIKKRVKSLFFPYIIWNLIAICFSLLKLYLRCVCYGENMPDIVTWFNGIGGIKFLYDTGLGYPANFPLWYIRDLMILTIISPVIFIYIKKFGIVGLIILYITYFMNWWFNLPGLSLAGLLFFSFGAYFSLHRTDYTLLFRKHKLICLAISCPLVIGMVLTYGKHNVLWGYIERLFTVFGTVSTIGIVASLLEKGRIAVHPFLSSSSFFVYAAHGTIALPLMLNIMSEILPNNQIGLILQYFLGSFLTISILTLIFYFLYKWMPQTASILIGNRIK